MKKYPVTWFFFILIVGLYIGTLVNQQTDPDHANDAQRKLGALSTLAMFNENLTDKTRVKTDLYGQFELWDGEFWRILVSGFHHLGLFHLFCNGISLLWLGKLLEPVMKKWAYALFIISGTYISFLPEIFLEHDLVGISGGLCAMFGLLIILRYHHVQIGLLVDNNMVRSMIYFLLGCIIVTQLEIFRVANIAHFTGLGYGIVFGIAFWGVPKWQLSRKQIRLYGMIFLLAHLLLIPATYYCVHPVWNGRYQWYLAYQLSKQRQDNKQLGILNLGQNNVTEEEVTHLKKAVEIDPGLSGAWNEIAIYYVQNGSYCEAWENILTGLQQNRSYEEGIRTAKKIWRLFSTAEDQKKAMEFLLSLFGDESSDWLSRFQMLPGQPNSIEKLQSENNISNGTKSILEFFSTPSEKSNNLPGFEKKPRELEKANRKQQQKISDPPDEDSEGKRL